MIIDRELQRGLLDKLAGAYPEELNIEPLGLPEPAASANLIPWTAGINPPEADPPSEDPAARTSARSLAEWPPDCHSQP